MDGAKVDRYRAVDNSIEGSGGGQTYLLDSVTGSASGNTLNGSPVELPLDDSQPAPEEADIFETASPEKPEIRNPQSAIRIWLVGS